MKSNKVYLLLMIPAIILLITGGFFLKGADEKTISAVFIGMGAGLFGLSIGNIISISIENKYPDEYRRVRIEQNDERNIMIKERAGAKANNIMRYALYLVTLVFGLTDVGLHIVLVMIALIILQIGLEIYFTNRYYKEL